MSNLTMAKHDWLCSIHMRGQPAIVFSRERQTEAEMRSYVLKIVMEEKPRGMEVWIGIRAMDTDPIVFSE